MNSLLKIVLSVIGTTALCPVAECRAMPPQSDSLVLQFNLRQSDALSLKDYRGNNSAIEALSGSWNKNSGEQISLMSDTESAPIAASEPEAIQTPATARKPLFALKTNLLFDAATMLNVELEVPIGQRFSIAGEWIFPWWLWEKKQHCLQMMSGNVEGKYWFGNRQNRPQLTGWFAGLYAGGGYYDLEWNRTGYQGEFFIALGVSGGYAHTINKSGNLRMEYSLGIGYMQTDYRKYEAKIGSDDAWHLYRRESGTYKWFGPTRAKISLVWMLNHTKKGGTK